MLISLLSSSLARDWRVFGSGGLLAKHVEHDPTVDPMTVPRLLTEERRRIVLVQSPQRAVRYG